MYSFTGIPRELKEVKVLNVATNSPAQIAQIIVGDKIISVDGVSVSNVSEFIAQIDTKKGKKLYLIFQDRKVTIIPHYKSTRR